MGGVGDFVRQDAGQFVVGVDEVQQAGVDVDVPARQRERVYVFVFDDVKMPGEGIDVVVAHAGLLDRRFRG